MNIKASAKKLNKSALIDLLDKAYGIDKNVDDIIKRYLLAHGEETKGSLTTILSKQIAEFASDNEFIDYHNSHPFSCRLDSLLIDIGGLLRSESLPQALQLTEQFVALTPSIMERCDDSNGEIGGILGEAVEQWLDIASELRVQNPDACNWVEKVLSFFENNDYGCFDDVIGNSRTLLKRGELKALAQDFEKKAHHALDNPKKESIYNSDASQACIGLASVAKALDNIELFEKSILIINPQPNTLQLDRIIKFSLKVNELARADYWLQQPQWQDNPLLQSRLRNELLKQQGNTVQLKQNLLDRFLQAPSQFTLTEYLEFANKQEYSAIKQKVEELAQSLQNPEDAIEILLVIENTPLAAKLTITHAKSLSTIFYNTLLQWAEHFEAKKQTLAAIACYRALLTDLLDRGYAKAYHHGARYFHKLLALDKQLVDGYLQLDDAQSYIRQIQDKHWRKRSFWSQADYPNKPGK